MSDDELFIQELSDLCSSEGIPIVLNAETVSMVFADMKFGDKYANKSKFKIFVDLREMALYAAFKVSQITKKRLPDRLHNRMVLDTSGYPFVRQYFKGLGAC